MDDFDLSEEIRSEFLVTRERKKIWAKELEILKFFDEFCKDNNLHYFVDYGTLLGAVRHKGFIPWDDDIDVSMLRDDYMKLLELAPALIGEPYFFQASKTDKLIMNFAKLRDENSSAIEIWDDKDIHQGIFIDIFPLDDVPDELGNGNNILKIEKELWECAYYQDRIKEKIALRKNGQITDLILEDDLLEALLSASSKECIEQLDSFCQNHFGKSSCVNYLLDEIYLNPPPKKAKREWFEETVLIPFENMMVPAPKYYTEVLDQRYGNWHEKKQGTSAHEGKIYFDPDRSYKEVIKRGIQM